MFFEDTIWTDIERFLRDPGEVAEILRQKITARSHDRAPDRGRTRSGAGALP
jgi:hypothetical protein